MRIFTAVLILSALALGANAQQKKYYAGVVSVNTAFVGKTISDYCSTDYAKSLDHGTGFTIAGIKRCDKQYISAPTWFYKIFTNTADSFYIKRDEVEAEDGAFEAISSMTPEQQIALNDTAREFSKRVYEGMKGVFTNFKTTAASKGVGILHWNIYDESEYTSGTSVKVEVYNPTKKTIKYLYFTFLGLNAVKDKIVDSRKGTSSIQTRAIGPIEPGQTGSYNWEYVWFTDLVATARITQIKVQYMDGTTKVIAAPGIPILNEEIYTALFSN